MTEIEKLAFAAGELTMLPRRLVGWGEETLPDSPPDRRLR